MMKIKVERKYKYSSVQYALVDDDMYPFLSSFIWRPAIRNHTIYACSYIKGKVVFMHNLVMPTNDKSLTPDHKNSNGLNNQRDNLRLATRLEQQRNKTKSDNLKTSNYKGVSYDKKNKKWEAYISENNKKRRLGRFSTEIEAAKAYNETAKKLYGEYAKLNDIEL